jgi:hypothetical protein
VLGSHGNWDISQAISLGGELKKLAVVACNLLPRGVSKLRFLHVAFDFVE